MDIVRCHILVCGGTGCTSTGSEELIKRLNAELSERNLDKEVRVIKTGCFGLCALGPVIVVYPEGAFYSRVKPEDIEEIVEEHILKGRVVKRLLHKEDEAGEKVHSLSDTKFYVKSASRFETAASSTRRTSTST